MEGILQIPPAVAEVAAAGDIGELDQPFQTEWQGIPDVAPYIDRQRELVRLTIEYVVRFTPLPLGSTAIAPEQLTVSFELRSGGQVLFRAPQELSRAVFISGLGIGYYAGQINTDFTNPLTVWAGSRLEWRFSGVLERQAGVQESLEDLEETREAETVPQGEALSAGVLEGALGEGEGEQPLSANLEGGTQLPNAVTSEQVKRQVVKETPYQRSGQPTLYFGIGYELEKE